MTNRSTPAPDRAFDSSRSPFGLTLAHKALYNLADASGLQIVCTSGSVWLTLDNDPRDVILEAGQSFFTTEHKHAVLYALEDSSVKVEVPASVAVVSEKPRSAAKLGTLNLQHPQFGGYATVG